MPAAAAPAPARPMTRIRDFNNFEDDFAVRMGLLPPQDRFDFLDRRGAFKAALKCDEIWANRHRTLGVCLSMLSAQTHSRLSRTAARSTSLSYRARGQTSTHPLAIRGGPAPRTPRHPAHRPA